MISICIPKHTMRNGDMLLNRCRESIRRQKYTDYEIIEKNEGSFAKNVNLAIEEAKGEIIHIMCMDDYFFDDNSLQRVADAFPFTWLVAGCINDDGKYIYNPHFPEYNDAIHRGKNTIGAPSVLAFENKSPLLFDENLRWLVDCDYYKRLYDRYGLPKILESVNIIQGIGEHQSTHEIRPETMQAEYDYITKKYD
jgi:hypothetical protein